MTHEAVRCGSYFAAAARVRAALRADAERSAALRFDADVRACFARDFFEGAAWPSRFNALRVARERLGEPTCLSNCEQVLRVYLLSYPVLVRYRR